MLEKSRLKPRVLMVAPTPGKYGGIEAFTATIATNTMLGDGIEVRVVFRLRKGGELTSNLTEPLTIHGIPWRLMKGLDFQYLKDLLWADVVNCHFPLVYVTYPALLLRKKLAVTMENRCLAVHGWRFKLGLRLAHARWYISSFVAGTWEGARPWPNSKIIPAVSDLPSNFVEPAKRKGLFFIARWVPLKGLEQLIEAYSGANIDHRANPLILLGDGELRGLCQKMILDAGIEDFVDAPGFVTHEEKCARMAAARWNIAPAAFPEDLGLSPIEARACAVPSIATRIGGLPEAAGEHALLCEPADVPSLRKAIERAVNMDEVEYLERCNQGKASLAEYLPPDDFYRRSFAELSSLQPIPPHP